MSITNAGIPSGVSRTSGGYNTWPDVLYVFEHKTQKLLIRAPYIRIVVFWLISNTLRDFVK